MMSCNALWAYVTNGNFHYFQRRLTVSCTALTAGRLPAVSAVQGDCERVYLITWLSFYTNQSHVVTNTWKITSTVCPKNYTHSSYFLVFCWGSLPYFTHIIQGCFTGTEAFLWLQGQSYNSGLILGLRPANERRRYFVTTSPIGWAQA